MSNYKEIKNFFHNTCGLQRSEIKAICREVIQEIAKDELNRYFQSGAFESKLFCAVTKSSWGATFDTLIERNLKEAVLKVIQKHLETKFDINIDVEKK